MDEEQGFAIVMPWWLGSAPIAFGRNREQVVRLLVVSGLVDKGFDMAYATLLPDGHVVVGRVSSWVYQSA